MAINNQKWLLGLFLAGDFSSDLAHAALSLATALTSRASESL